MKVGGSKPCEIITARGGKNLWNDFSEKIINTVIIAVKMARTAPVAVLSPTILHVTKAEIVTIRILTRLFTIRMVAKSPRGSDMSLTNFLSFGFSESFRRSSSSSFNEKKATSEPETKPDIIKRTRRRTPLRI